MPTEPFAVKLRRALDEREMTPHALSRRTREAHGWGSATAVNDLARGEAEPSLEAMEYIGQVLQIPRKTTEKVSKEGLKTYQVKSGDSPFRIAQLHNMDLKHFLKINRLTPRTPIYPGQTLYVE